MVSAKDSTSRTVGRPIDEELQARRRVEILNASTEVFAARGFAATDVQEIANRIGVGKGTIYRYFPSKEELFLAAVDNGMKQLKAAVELAADSNKPPLECVAGGILAYLTFFDQHREIVELLVQERAFFGPSGFTVGNGMISGERIPLKCKTKSYTNRYLA